MQDRTRTGVSLFALALVVALLARATIEILVSASFWRSLWNIQSPPWSDPTLSRVLGLVFAGLYGVVALAGALVVERDRGLEVLPAEGSPDRPRIALAFAVFAGITVGGLDLFLYPEYVSGQSSLWSLRFFLQAGVAIAVGMYFFWTAVRLGGPPTRRFGFYALGLGITAGIFGPLSGALLIWGPATGGLEGNRPFYDTVATLSVAGLLVGFVSLGLWLMVFLRIRASSRSSPVLVGRGELRA